METTTHEYEDGLLVRSVTAREPEWTEDDRAWMFALSLYRSQQCPLHGGPLSECTSTEEDGPEFVVRRKRCRAQDALLSVQGESKNTDRPGAVLWSIQKK